MQTDVVEKFEHIAYGAWATVSGPEGSGFTHESIGDAYLVAVDDARTPVADMPASGTATWLGQSTGFITTHDGTTARGVGDVTMTADFANARMTVDLLATTEHRSVLSGTIDGNGFSGTTIERMSGSALIQAEGATATFSGGFYGGGAEEAGGVFEIVGGRAQNPGRLVGAFGGRMTE